MRALVYEGPKTLKLREFQRPEPKGNEVLIRVAYSGICGSELSGYLGRNSLRTPPCIFGHEFSGTIELLGPDVRDRRELAPGTKVTANPLITCGRCLYCSTGRQQLCVNRKLLSAALPGSNAEYVAVPADFVYVLPDNLSLAQGALAEPIACALRVAELAAAKPHESVLIVGMGPIGLLALQAIALCGCTRLIVVDKNKDRLALAKQLGASEAICPPDEQPADRIRQLTDGMGADVAVDAVGAGSTRRQCVENVRSGGRVIFTGLHEADSELPVNHMIRQEISGTGSFAYSTANFELALRLLSEGRIGLSQGIAEAPLEEGGAWFERLLDNPGDVTKVLLRPSCDPK